MSEVAKFFAAVLVAICGLFPCASIRAADPPKATEPVKIPLPTIQSPPNSENPKQVILMGRGGDTSVPILKYSTNPTKWVTYDVDYSVVVTAPYKTKLLRVWIPVPPNTTSQRVGRPEWSTFPTTIEPRIASEPTFGNRFAYFEFEKPQGAQIIRQQLRVEVAEMNWQIDARKLTVPETWPDELAPYLRSESQAVVIAAKHRELLSQLIPQRTNPAAEMNAVMAYALERFRYDHVVASLAADSEHALRTGSGHCSDYHGFCAAVGRALGYPTRVTYGINTFPKASPSHCKLEAYLPPYGWVSFDVSETQKMTTAIRNNGELDEATKARLIEAAVARLQSGFRDNTWYLQTVGTDYDLVPAASRRVPVVRTIYAEADGVPLADPDPSDPNEKAFSWMTSTKFTSDRPVSNPFENVESLK